MKPRDDDCRECYVCPSCGYPGLRESAWVSFDKRAGPSHEICPCCGVEFGYHDHLPSMAERYRRDWISRGAPWFRPDSRPPCWDLRTQLRGISVDLDDYV